jgi:hypothetical protein
MSLTSSPISSERADLTDSRLAALCAETVRGAFLEYEERFRAITLRARERFLARDWQGSYADAAERLRLYARQIETLTEQFKKIMGTRLSERSVWTGMKAVYSSLIAQSPKREIAESFFNSLTRRVFATEGVDQAIEFVDTDFDEAPTTPLDNRRTYSGASIHELLIASLVDRHGAYGKIGLSLVEKGPDVWTVKLLLMSCRVMSKGVGTIMIQQLLRRAKEAGVRLRAEFVSNDRNRQMLITYRFAGFKEVERVGEVAILENDFSALQPPPSYVDLRLPE